MIWPMEQTLVLVFIHIFYDLTQSNDKTKYPTVLVSMLIQMKLLLIVLYFSGF